MGAYNNIDNAVDGLLYGVAQPRIESAIAKEDIAYGTAVFGHAGYENQCYGAHLDRSTVTLDADLVASNVYTLTVNGTAVAVTYATSHAATMTALIAALNAKAELIALGISAAPGSTNRIIVLKARGIAVTVTGAVTLGASQAGVTVAADTWGQFLGVAQFTQRAGRDYGAGSSKYLTQDSVNIVSLGELYVPTGAVTINALEKAYVVMAAGSTLGTFTNVSTSNFDCKSYFRTNSLTNRSVLGVRLGITP